MTSPTDCFTSVRYIEVEFNISRSTEGLSMDRTHWFDVSYLLFSWWDNCPKSERFSPIPQQCSILCFNCFNRAKKSDNLSRDRMAQTVRAHTCAAHLILDSSPTNTCMCASMWIKKGLVAILAIKSWVGVTPDVNLGNLLQESYKQGIHPGFETQDIHHQSKTEVSVAPQKGTDVLQK